MGLFKRSNSSEDGGSDDYNEIELPRSSDLNEDQFAPSEPELGITQRKSYSPKTGYSIEDAIELMKALPRDNNEVVVTVVKKTLESTDIKVGDIIDDANSREKRIRAQHKKLEEEIKQLQEKIAQRNQQITDLLQDLKETSDVRQRLELALKLDSGKDQKANEKPATTTSAAGGNSNTSTASAAFKPAVSTPPTASSSSTPQPTKR